MKGWQAIVSIVLASALAYAGGYFTHLVRFPHWKSVAALPKTVPKYRHPLVAQLEKARTLRAEGKLSDAQKLVRDQLRLYPQAEDAQAARELLGSINTELFFSQKSLYAKTEYTVARGDSLARIAQKLHSSPEMIMRANNLDSTVIRPGDRLLVPDGEFTVTIDLSNERVVVHHGDAFFKQYPIQSIELPRSSQTHVTTKVGATTFWKDGERIKPDAAEVDESTPWIHLDRPGYILYGISEEHGVEPESVEVTEARNRNAASGTAEAASDPDVPPRGIALLKDDLFELQLLLRRGTPVTIIRARK
jgi:LysM repeat protein